LSWRTWTGSIESSAMLASRKTSSPSRTHLGVLASFTFEIPMGTDCSSTDRCSRGGASRYSGALANNRLQRTVRFADCPLNPSVRPLLAAGVRLGCVANGSLDWPVPVLLLCKRFGRTSSYPRRARLGHCEVLAGTCGAGRFAEIPGSRVEATGGIGTRGRCCVLGGLA
jgi:hypothetical protein